MKRFSLLLLSLLVFSLASCSVSLEEKENAFENLTGKESMVCGAHHLVYSPATAQDPYGIYSSSQYHYVQCALAKQGLICDFEPHFEIHTKQVTTISLDTKLMYNDSYYHTASFICNVCNRDLLSTEYILCTSIDGKCDGACQGIKEVRGGQ